MTNLSKRIITSMIIILTLLISLNSIYLISLLLLLFFYQIVYEFLLLIRKIFDNLKIYQYIFSLIFIIYIFLISFKIFIVFFNNISEEKTFLFLLITICIFTDIGGYIFGKSFKGKKLTSISPNKTYSGAFGSFLIPNIIVLLFFDNFYDYEYILMITLSVSFISQSGDLFISYLKRKAKVKDTGKILPGHGGILDRLDGIIFAIPFGFLISNI